jgi:hypothetical protein
VTTGVWAELASGISAAEEISVRRLEKGTAGNSVVNIAGGAFYMLVYKVSVCIICSSYIGGLYSYWWRSAGHGDSRGAALARGFFAIPVSSLASGSWCVDARLEGGQSSIGRWLDGHSRHQRLR